ncbi:DUF2721 domain-containing protein [Solimonas sp. K1W22B-7]|uniref:DUF2721 domain-containing protein n=1 Tax=Solimonas sp. K1W22B-7 TaxID=2303331 RepID=UPI000E330AB5|nr:DUF2721 domain-containing protein [Solimonas sp. K1W22B-7]AXQ31433.1 DUF2721 domain-containing protein [Solimonas sp. K1W22B-7]
MVEEGQVLSIAHTIQLAVAPVFLLAGIGSMLGVLTNRLARVIDKARKLEERFPAAADPVAPDIAYQAELRVLARRARYLQVAIGCCVGCALLVALVVVTLFVSAVFDLNAFAVVAFLFIAAMLAFITGLLCFMREIHLGLINLRIGPRPRV